MATITANLNEPKSDDIVAATVSLIRPGDDVRVIWVRPNGLMYFFYGVNPDDGDTVTGSILTDRFPINANEAWPVEVVPGRRIGMYADTGTVNVHVLGIRGEQT